MSEHRNDVERNAESLVVDHLWLVDMLANRLARRIEFRVEVEDLYQIGCLGLMEAAKRYDPSKGFLFKTFANLHIYGEMFDFLRKNSQFRRLRKGQEKFTVISIDTGMDSGSEACIGYAGAGSAELFATDHGSQASSAERLLILEDLLKKTSLTKREADILRERFWNELTRRESAEIHGCNRTRISQLERGALHKLAAA